MNVSAGCGNVDHDLKIVVTDPQLPVEHGITVSYRCVGKYAKKGDVDMVCQHGFISGDSTPCFKIGKIATISVSS